MIKLIIILFIVMVSVIVAKSEYKSLGQSEYAPTNFLTKNDDHTLADTTFISKLGGAVEIVWQQVEKQPGESSVLTNHIYAASDGSYYIASVNFGGFLTKISKDGAVEWTIDREFSNDTSRRYRTIFQDISELANGDILVYGNESLTGQIESSYSYPIRFVISPTGNIREEKNTHNVLPKPIFLNHLYPIFPDTKIFRVSLQSDSISFISFNSSFTNIQSRFSLRNDYPKDPSFVLACNAMPYNSTSFIFTYQGTLPTDNLKSFSILQFSKEYELLRKLVILKNANELAKVSICNDGLFMVLLRDYKGQLQLVKYDTNGKLIWQKQPETPKNFVFDNCNISKSQNGGFFLCGEIFKINADGTANYESEQHLGIIVKLSEDGTVEWYFTSTRNNFRNTIQDVAEASNGDVVFVCNSLGLSANQKTPMQITRLRPKASAVAEQPAEPDGIHLFPNPTSTQFTLSGVEGVASVRVVNSLGEEVKQFTHVSSQYSIDVSDLVSGLYFVSISTAKGAVVKPMMVSR
ncbi:MAG: T9SS type A sorting domain-containing protein [Bacteroidetes bacterium]|nr:T9SS type A sorting domain-containing protein [Bacteroidota bacterium]